MVDLELRKQVAEARGWIGIEKVLGSALQGYCPVTREFEFVPPFDLSIDAIAQEFDKKDWNYILERESEEDDIFYIASTHVIEGHYAKTPAIALCKLFLFCIDFEAKYS